jgi:hypothetical protein
VWLVKFTVGLLNRPLGIAPRSENRNTVQIFRAISLVDNPVTLAASLFGGGPPKGRPLVERIRPHRACIIGPSSHTYLLC